jgi:uncharacterized protein (TIGR02147 family)
MSAEMARRIAGNLKLNKVDEKVFSLSVSSQHSKDMKERHRAKLGLDKFFRQKNLKILSIDEFKTLSDWYHLSIVELAKVKGFRFKASWIARKLGIVTETVLEAIERLKKVGILADRKGRLEVVSASNRVDIKIPSLAIRVYHTQLIQKGLRAIYEQDIHERHIASTQVAVREMELPRFFERIQEMRRQICEEFDVGSASDADHLYCFATQLFRLSETEEKRSTE